MIDWSTVEIEDKHVTALRLLLREGPDAWQRLQDEAMMSDQAAAGYMQMFHAAFSVAVRRKFTPDHSVHEVVRYVAELRIELKKHSNEDLSPRIAENAIRGSLGNAALQKENEALVDEDIKNLEHLMTAESLVLFDVLLTEEKSGEGEVEAYVREATDLARRWVSEKQDAQAEERGSAGEPFSPGTVSEPGPA
ncbi:hypothetical protein ETD83_10175 [Actinomadura soli]|uniref:Uncharacterized protein n=1 Tax=Actinomadura soli TaxID=2508997 RepID=A0A5C4JFM2_9ACTN|nr:hypothetical protein [Actinomadura soli]TMR03686.1 hypothetical protein ETD83_10175 [Actinomadura soli]